MCAGVAMTLAWLLFLLAAVRLAEPAKILAIMAVASRSHHIWNSAITDELARRGHEVTYFSPDKDPKAPPNVRQIHAEGSYEKVHADIDINEMVNQQGTFALMGDFDNFGVANCEAVVASKGFDELLRVVRAERFDLILIDVTITECVHPVADLAPETPIVGVSAYGGTANANYLTGNPENLATKPNTYLPFANNMTLVQRIQNVVVQWYSLYDRFNNFLPRQLAVARTKIPSAQSVHTALDRMSIFLVNNHYAFDPPGPTVPALIHVGGVHIRPPKPLPKDIQTYLDGAKDGAIFFALGSNVESSKIPKEKLKAMLTVFEKLAPMRILWKFEKDLPEKPKNVMIGKWMPQSDILAHPNVKLFFTHSGLLSTQEALYHGKPVVGMPFLVDQYININRCVRDGLGEKVDFLTLTEHSLLSTIRKVLDNPRYREKAEFISRVFRDQPQTPLERATFWIEYVIRHKGAHHLRSPTLNLTWYQNELVDVVLVLAAVLLTLLFIAYKLAKTILCAFFGKKQKKLKQR